MATYYGDNTKSLLIYYQRLFPFKEICTWIGYGSVRRFSHREFSFRLHSDLIIRNQTFCISKMLVTRVLADIPKGIDIGAVYTINMLGRGRPKIFAEKELLFDIDISDYDHIRSCCKGPNICKKCWRYIVIACNTLNYYLDYCFGCKHILWIFSGRRGIHCWVCDENIRIFDQTIRSGMLEFITRSKGEDLRNIRSLPEEKLNYYNRLFLKTIEPEFVPLCIIEQNLLATEEGLDYFLSLLPSDEARTDVKQLFKDHQSSIDRWNAFVEYHNDMIRSNTVYWQGWEEFVDRIKLHYCFPILDPNVTEDTTHLLKCPFSVHPGTDKIVVPFDIAEVELFDPTVTPTLEQLIKEIEILDEFLPCDKKEDAINIYQKTSLKKPLDIFKKFVEKLAL